MAPLTGCDDSPWDSERASLSEITDADGLGLMLLAIGMARWGDVVLFVNLISSLPPFASCSIINDVARSMSLGCRSSCRCWCSRCFALFGA